MKKDKLHTVNKWNRPAFMPKENLFALGGADVSGMSDSDFLSSMNSSFNRSISTPTTSNTTLNTSALDGLRKQQSGMNNSSSNWGSMASQIGSSVLNTPAGDKLLDTLDPVYHLAGGRESAVGNAFSDAGKGLFKAGASTGNLPLMFAGAAAKVGGGLINAASGIKTNKKLLNEVNNGINTYSNYNSNAGYYDDINTPEAVVSNTNVYEGGWFSKGKARRKNQALQTKLSAAKSWADRSVDNNIGNIASDQINTALTNYAAYGGLLNMMGDNSMGATEYGLMSDYLNMKDRQAQNKGNMTGYLGNTLFADGGSIHINPKNEGKLTETAKRTGKSFSELAHSKNPLTRKRAQFALNARHFNHKHDDGGYIDMIDSIDNDRGFFDNDTLFALGGILQTNGTEWGQDGLTEINAGQSHEQNPYDGVQMGVAPDGEPNLVEEGETIFNDYVFSNRIKPTKDVLKKFHMYSKGSKLTYADVSKKLEKEAKERPNDPISQASLKDMLSQLADAQEEQKAKEEAEKARKAFEALSPEEQQEVLRQIAEQQQAQANAEQQGNPQEEQIPVDENGNPINGQDMQDMQNGQTAQEQPMQDMQAPTMEDTNAVQGVTAANGGELHKFDKGGKKNSWKTALSDAYKLNTVSDWNKAIQDAGFKDFDFNKYEDNQTGYNKFLYELQQALGDESYRKFTDSMAKKNPAFNHALSKGYAFDWNQDAKPDYDWKALSKAMSEYTKSEVKGNNPEFYYKDYDSEPSTFGLGDFKDINALEDSQAYKDFTAKVLDFIKKNPSWKENYKELSKEDVPYARYLNELTKRVPEGTNINNLVHYNTDTGEFTLDPKAAEWYNKGRIDHIGGEVHFTPSLMDTTPITNNYLINGNNIDDLTGTPTGKPVNTYTWIDDNGIRHTNNYYNLPENADNKSTTDNGEERKLPYLEDRYRYAGLFSPAIGLGLWAAGVGKPDYSGFNAAMNYANQGNGLADVRYVGDYEKYVPWDIWASRTAADASARATDRAIMNNGTNIGAKNAGLIANGYNRLLADAALQRQARESNDTRYDRTVKHNLGVNEFDAQAYNQASATNAEIQNRNRQFQANLMGDYARTKLNADAQWYNAPYAGLTEFGNAWGNYGRENAEWNKIAALANNGVFGAPASEWGHYGGSKKGVKMSTATPKYKAAKGGKLKKRGLTF